jgi:hypothetical protein
VLALLFASFDFNFAIFARAILRHAVREGVRFAVTGQTLTGMGHDASIKQIVKNNAMGFLGASGSDEKIKIRYYNPDTGAEVSANTQGNIVTVSIEGLNFTQAAALFRTNDQFSLKVTGVGQVELYSGTPPAR